MIYLVSKYVIDGMAVQFDNKCLAMVNFLDRDVYDLTLNYCAICFVFNWKIVQSDVWKFFLVGSWL